MALLAIAFGVLIMAHGVLGLVSPSMLASVVGTIEIAPIAYAASVTRVIIGTVLLVAAGSSRAPWSMRCLGGVILLAGVLTPFLAPQIAHSVLASWEEGGPDLVRLWAAAILAVGGFIAYANIPSRRAA